LKLNYPKKLLILFFPETMLFLIYCLSLQINSSSDFIGCSRSYYNLFSRIWLIKLLLKPSTYSYSCSMSNTGYYSSYALFWARNSCFKRYS